MHTRLIEIGNGTNEQGGLLPSETLSLRPYIQYLHSIKDHADSEKVWIINEVIRKYEAHPQLSQGIDVKDIARYADLLKLLYFTLTPILQTERDHYWALSMPVSKTVFYSTHPFFELVINAATGKLKAQIDQEKLEQTSKSKLEFLYSLVLQKMFNISSILKPEMIYPLINDQTGLTQYFKITVDSRFIEVSCKGECPSLSIEDFDGDALDKAKMFARLQELLPLHLFHFEGLNVMTITDVTPQYAVENIKNILLSPAPIADGEICAPGKLVQSLKALIGNNNVEFGLFPVLKVNNKVVFNDTVCSNSLLLKVARQKHLEQQAQSFLTEKYFPNPAIVCISKSYKEDTPEAQALAALLKQENITAYVLVPVLFGDKLVGIMEIYTRSNEELNEVLLSKLDPAGPYLSQIFENSIDEFNARIEHVVKDHFTALQPAVQWKFNEAAWHYLRDNNMNAPTVRTEIENIIFDKVYPLYGAVDLRNSTVQRNEALQKDLQTQFDLLIKTLSGLRDISGFTLLEEKIYSAQRWQQNIQASSGLSQDARLTDFLDNEILPFLLDFEKGDPRFVPIIDAYLAAIDETKGAAHHHRRQLEVSMSTVIAAVNNYMELMKDEIQKAYPCYFEKFRTDGVEYDIYIGQSIAPQKPFSDIYLSNLRLLQLTSMAAIAKYTHSLLNQLTNPIYTTQLIFIHSHPIDIKFRKDEKRFDVEGTYNIRYHIIKKRIDKVHIKDTKERLTQPDKIALVYFNQKEADEYISYISYLQKQGILADDLEFLDLEPLQGVTGLKAMRVGVVL
jgi:hypothetical protein